MATLPSRLFWDAVVMDQDRSQTFQILHQKNIAFEIEAPIGTHTGSMSFQGRLAGSTKWHDIIPPVAVNAGAEVTILTELSNLGCEEVRVLFTFTGGTGALTGRWSWKQGAR